MGIDKNSGKGSRFPKTKTDRPSITKKEHAQRQIKGEPRLPFVLSGICVFHRLTLYSTPLSLWERACSLSFKIKQNQLALEAAIMELTLWVGRRGSAEAAGHVRGALDTFSKNENFMNLTLTVLMAPE
jgi:hypothetical protein